MTLPDRIAELVATHTQNSPIVQTGPVTPGDVRLIKWPNRDQYRHVLVVKVNSDTGTTEVLLLHSTLEMATQFDIVLRPEETGTPYVLIAQTDVRGLVWTIELEQVVGRVTRDIGRFSLERCWNLEDGGLRGSRLAGSLDVRWAFKRIEGSVIAELSKSCIHDVLDNLQLFSVSTETLHHLLELKSPKFTVATDRLTEILVEQQLVIATSTTDATEIDVFKSSLWKSRDEAHGQEIAKLLSDLALQRATSDASKDDYQNIIELSIERLISA